MNDNYEYNNRYYLFRLANNKSKVYRSYSNYPFSLIRAEEQNIKFMSRDSLLNEFNNRILSNTERIIKTPIQKKSISSVYDYYDADNNDRHIILLGGSNKLAEVYSHTVDNVYDTYKIVYNYEFLNHSPYSINITDIDEENSYFVLSQATAKDDYKCDKLNSGNHKFTEKICDKKIILPDAIKYKIPFNVQYNSDYFVINGNEYRRINGYSNKIMEKMIDSPLETNPITSFSYEIDIEYTMIGFTPGYYFSLNYNNNEKKCTVDIKDIKEFKDENGYTIIKDKKDDSIILYCFNVSFDDYNVYCDNGKNRNWLIEVYADSLLKIPKIRIYMLLFIFIYSNC